MRAALFGLTLLVAFQVAGLSQDFEAGLHAYENKDYDNALKQWRPLAEAGFAPTQFNLGLMYLDGTGVPQNFSEAAEWFRRSADQGYPKAQYNLGALYAVGKGVRKDLVSAYMWMDLCAAKGDAKCVAQRDLIAKKLKSRDLAEGQRRAAAWQPAPAPPANLPGSPKP